MPRLIHPLLMLIAVQFFIHIHTRRVHIAGMTPNPDGVWMAQQARNMSMIFDDEPDEYKPTHIIRDRDSKYGPLFSSVAKSTGIKVLKTPVRAPKANAICERFIGSLRRECLD